MNNTAYYLLASFGVVSGIMLVLFGVCLTLVFVESLKSPLTLNLFERMFNYSGIYFAGLIVLLGILTGLYSSSLITC